MDTNSLDYFDHAAATPLDADVFEAMRPYLTDNFYNPSATYGPARMVAAGLRAARARVAYWLGARPSEVVFTAGGTEANNLTIRGVMEAAAAGRLEVVAGRLGAADASGTAGRPGLAGLNVVVSAIEHESVLQPAARYEARQAGVTPDGLLDVAALRACIDDNTALVSVMYANNEVGTIQPLREAAAVVAEVREDRRRRGVTVPIYLHTDACQAANYLDLHAARLGVDLMTLNGGKIYGPKQSGVLYVRAGVPLRPLIWGGGQEHGLRSGTENVAACIGLTAALDEAQTRRHAEVRRLRELQQRFLELLEQHLADWRGADGRPLAVNGSLKKRLPNNIHLTLPGEDNERLLLKLEAAGVLAAAGSACSASNEEPSHVLRTMGLSDADAQASLRFTMGRATDAAAVERAVAALAGTLSH